MKISDAAKQLGVTRQAVYQWINEGKVKTCHNFDGSKFISKKEVERLLKERNNKC
jgi:excisionase family DNA binding protein